MVKGRTSQMSVFLCNLKTINRNRGSKWIEKKIPRVLANLALCTVLLYISTVADDLIGILFGNVLTYSVH